MSEEGIEGMATIRRSPGPPLAECLSGDSASASDTMSDLDPPRFDFEEVKRMVHGVGPEDRIEICVHPDMADENVEELVRLYREASGGADVWVIRHERCGTLLDPQREPAPRPETLGRVV